MIKALLQCLGVSSGPETLPPLLLSLRKLRSSYRMKYKLVQEKNCHQHGSLAWLANRFFGSKTAAPPHPAQITAGSVGLLRPLPANHGARLILGSTEFVR